MAGDIIGNLGRQLRGATPLQTRTVIGAGLILLVVVTSLVLAKSSPVPSADAIRYITMALNLADHGVLSAEQYSPDRVPSPTLLQGGALVGLELATASLLDSATRAVFTCVTRQGMAAPDCAGELLGLKVLRIAEVFFAMVLLAAIALRILGNPWLSVVAVVLALAMREVLEFTNQALSEPLYLAVYVLFAWQLLRLADENRRWFDALLAGLAFGLVVLAKPAVAPLIVVVPALLLVDSWWRDRAPSQGAGLAATFAAAGLCVILPWILRNWVVAGTFGLADPYYLEAALSHRFAYNAMTWSEWLAGWVYYLPDFGDGLAAALFAPDSYARLGWSEASYYVYGRDVLHLEAKAVTSPAPAVGHLIATYVIGEPVKFSAVSLLLLWRGLFVARLIGLAAVVVLPFALRSMSPAQRHQLIYLGLPALAIAGINAALSVSIARYNLAFVPLYAVVLAWIVGRIEQRLTR